MTSPFLGEFMGTMVLVLIGDANVCNVVLKKSKGEGSGWIVIATGWAMAVMAGVFVAIACGSGDAHINPAVTLGAAIISGNWDKLATYVPAQMLGAITGAILVWLSYLPHWAATPDGGAKLACFSTGPAIRNTVGNLLTEIIGTFLLMLIIASIVSKAVSPGPGLVPVLVGATVWGLGLSIGGATGFSLNPARDLGPRIAHAILPIPAKGDSDWGYAAIPVVGPLMGAAIAGVVVKVIGF